MNLAGLTATGKTQATEKSCGGGGKGEWGQYPNGFGQEGEGGRGGGRPELSEDHLRLAPRWLHVPHALLCRVPRPHPPATTSSTAPASATIQPTTQASLARAIYSRMTGKTDRVVGAVLGLPVHKRGGRRLRGERGTTRVVPPLLLLVMRDELRECAVGDRQLVFEPARQLARSCAANHHHHRGGPAPLDPGQREKGVGPSASATLINK